jgi:hypothetical protein
VASLFIILAAITVMATGSSLPATLPVFVNDQAPALNATNLNAIVNAITPSSYDAIVYFDEDGNIIVRARNGTILATQTAGDADNVVIQAAIDSLPATGGYVQLVLGTYYNAGTITINKGNVTLNGISPNKGTVIYMKDNANCDCISVNANYCVISNLRIEGNIAHQTGGDGIQFVNALDCEIRSVSVMYSKEYGLNSAGSGNNGNSVYDSYFEYCGYSGIYTRGRQNFFYNIDCYGNTVNGIFFAATDAIPRTELPTGIECSIINSRFEGNSYAGIFVAEDSYSHPGQLLQVSGCQIVGNKKQGVYIQGGRNVILYGNVIRDNSQQTTNTYDNIYIEKSAHYDSTQIQVIACQLLDSGWTKRAKYQINESDANQDYNLYACNIIEAGATGTINKQGLNSLIRSNIGVADSV